MYNIFIDGKEGTTGLQIYDRLAARSDINLITLPEELRKDRDARRECLNRADISFLCLPDAAAVDAVSLVENERSRMIDASTAHRTSPGWVYGFAELSAKKRAEIAAADRVANPGCYATGFISLVAPLVAGGIASPEYPFVCHALSGYSGAGKKGIAQYLAEAQTPARNGRRVRFKGCAYIFACDLRLLCRHVCCGAYPRVSFIKKVQFKRLA